MPHIKAVYEKYYQNDPQVAFVLVSIDTDPKRLQRYLSESKFPFPIGRTSFETAQKLFNVADTPTTFYVDKAGTIRYQVTGIEPHGDADARIAWYIEQLKK